MTHGKSVRELLADKDLVGFKKSLEKGPRAIERASSAKVTIIKAPKRTEESDSGKERA